MLKEAKKLVKKDEFSGMFGRVDQPRKDRERELKTPVKKAKNKRYQMRQEGEITLLPLAQRG